MTTQVRRLHWGPSKVNVMGVARKAIRPQSVQIKRKTKIRQTTINRKKDLRVSVTDAVARATERLIVGKMRKCRQKA